MASRKDEPKKNIHEGHRKRLSARYDKSGLNDFEEHNILELLLFYSIPRVDTNPHAHNLLNTFSSLYDVLTAPAKKLTKVDGIGPASARMLRVVFESARKAVLNKITSRPLCTYGQIHQIAVEWFADKLPGAAIAVLMDDKKTFLDILEVTTEYAMIASTPAQAILPLARKLNARNVVYIHNHSEDELFPSDTDLLSTYNLYHDLAGENIVLLEHLIVAGFDTLPVLNRSLGKNVTGYPFISE